VLNEKIIKSLQQLSSKELEAVLLQRKAEDQALRILWRAAVARERQERRNQLEAEQDATEARRHQLPMPAGQEVAAR
jgi:hypothetical protein